MNQAGIGRNQRNERSAIMAIKQTIDYSEVTQQNRSAPTMLKQCLSPHGLCNLQHKTAGYEQVEEAENMWRWTDEKWSAVAVCIDGGVCVKHYKIDAEARAQHKRNVERWRKPGQWH